jgi:hypothetical protein
MKMNLLIQTKNPILRAWGNFCGRVADFFLDQSIKYGDMYQLERFLDEFEKLPEDVRTQIHNIDDTFAWKDDD